MTVDWILLPIAVVGFFWALKKIPSGYLLYPSTEHLIVRGRAHFAEWPRWLKLGALALLLIAFINPRKETRATSIETGRALFLVLDHSGSMKEKLLEEGKNLQLVSKMDQLKKITGEFIEDRSQQDLLGLVEFARVPRVLVPLTRDRQIILSQLDKINVATKNEDNGTAIGYAIYKISSIIGAMQLNNAAIILVTDGFQYTNEEDLTHHLRALGIEEGAKFAEEQRVHLYIVSLDPQIDTPEFGPQRRLMERSTKRTGGAFFFVKDASQISQIYQQIDALESISYEVGAPQYTLYWKFFILSALALFLASLILEITWLRRYP